MRTRPTLTLVAFAVTLPFAEPAHAQRAPGAARAGDAAVAPNQNVAVVPLQLRRDAVRVVADQMSAAGASRGRRRGLAGALQSAITGDRSQIDAAKRVLGQMAQALDADGNTTVVVVIGGEEERDHVVGSLARVRRPVRVAYVDRDFADAVSDNTVLVGGVAGAVTDAATNLWVYLPRRGGPPREKPDRVLSTKVASPTLWNGLFAADGEALDVDQVASLGRRAEPADAPTRDGALAVGDVVIPKIGTVRVHQEASATSRVVGTVSRSDELVVTAPPTNGFVRVEGASVAGWVSAPLVGRK